MPITLNGSGTVSGISAGGLPDGCIQSADIASGVIPAGGKILKVESASTNNKITSTSLSYVDLMSSSITTTADNSKILLIAHISISKFDNHSFLGRFLRNGSAISGTGGVKDFSSQEDGVWLNVRSATYSVNPQVVVYLDSPSVNASTSLTYKVQGKTTNTGYGFAFNRTLSNSNTLHESTVFSNIALMEISA